MQSSAAAARRSSSMLHSNDREATASIRGYRYQFDATILAILALDNENTLTIEGTEDFDIDRGDISELFQFKYYASKKLTPSVIRDAILPMFKGFLLIDHPQGILRNYH
ncbi:MAG: hypothetical protein ACR2QH_03040, partial [Geminicoccaceae bacterium]